MNKWKTINNEGDKLIPVAGILHEAVDKGEAVVK
jgi:hypothetical protein